MTHFNGFTHQSRADSGPHPPPQPLMSLHTQKPPTLLNHPPDPQTRATSKQYFKLIQAIHHKNIMDTAQATHTVPPGMMRQVTRLTNFIKPSTPTEDTYKKIHSNTAQWMQNTILILQQHYSLAINSFPTNAFNPLALQIAIGWARKRYGPKLTSGTLISVNTILQTKPSSGGCDVQPPTPRDLENFPPLPAAKAPQTLVHFFRPLSSPISSCHQNNLTVEPSHASKLTPNRQPPARSGPIKVSTSLLPASSATPSTLPQSLIKGATLMSPPSSIPSLFPTITPRPQRTSEIPRKDSSTQEAHPEENSMVPSISIPSVSFNQTLQPGSKVAFPLLAQQSDGTGSPGYPAGRRTPSLKNTPLQGEESAKMMRGNVEVKQDHQTTHSEPSSTNRVGTTLPSYVPDQSTLVPLPSLEPTSLLDLSNMDDSPHQFSSRPPQTPTPSSPHTSSCEPTPAPPSYSDPPHPPGSDTSPIVEGSYLQDNISQQDPISVYQRTLGPVTTEPRPNPSFFTSPFSPTTPKLFAPTYHQARSNRKIQSWSFKPRKPVLILGDSNINRIPPHNYSQIQLDSYPGATIYHFLKVCEKTPPNPQVKIVIFSVGINNKDQDPKQTSIKQLKGLFRQAKSTFPNADLYFPIMNFSSHLSPVQRNNLKLINNTMTITVPFLTEIPHDTFHTEKDNIHWTSETANLIFHNWIQQLNLH
ncbi:uncharacterized protein LOC144994645 [Oryzias latipes]